MGRMKKKPRIMGSAVPTASMSRKSDVLPGKSVCAIVEKRNAERPKPEMTIPFAVARCESVSQRCWDEAMDDLPRGPASS